MTTLHLPGHAPSGLGFRPDGALLIVSSKAANCWATTAKPSKLWLI